MLFASSFELSSSIADIISEMEIAPFNADYPDEFEDILAEAEVIYSRQGFFDSVNLDLCRNVRWIHVPSAGYEQIALDVLRKRGIILTNGRGVYSGPIAEDVICKMLMLARNYPQVLEKQRNRQWGDIPKETEIAGKTLGLVGTGSIAIEIAQRAKAFGMTVVGYNTAGRPVSGFDGILAGKDGLKQLFKTSDYIVLAVPLNDRTKGLVSRSLLRIMKPTAYFINIARGPVVVENELILALEDGAIAGAALDVFSTEPLPSSNPLWSMPNVIITPHTSGHGDGVADRLKNLLIDNLKVYPEVSKMVNVVRL